MKQCEYIKKESAIKLLQNEIDALTEYRDSEDMSEEHRKKLDTRLYQLRYDLKIITNLPTYRHETN